MAPLVAPVLRASLGVASAVPRASATYQRQLTREAQARMGLGAPVARLAAQLQAESGWRPGASSGVADGLAQFTPETARWISAEFPDLGPPAPFSPGWALRAVVIYDAWLHARVLQTATSCDRWAMVLVAYNGGLGWLNSDRKLAKEKGADPSRWWATQQGVGSEPFTKRARWAFLENREYPKRILLKYEPNYLAAGWHGEAVCP